MLTKTQPHTRHLAATMAETTITRKYKFASAHWLPGVPETHKCHRIHGHSYRMEVSVRGRPDERGFVMDFAELDEVVNPLIERIDHRTLNDIAGLENPTAELIGVWFIERVPQACRVRVYEEDYCWADVVR
jgi:6-pyruvoyltetrahydropterin/6-carboxytetrahydropterin synthase